MPGPIARTAPDPAAMAPAVVFLGRASDQGDVDGIEVETRSLGRSPSWGFRPVRRMPSSRRLGKRRQSCAPRTGRSGNPRRYPPGGPLCGSAVRSREATVLCCLACTSPQQPPIILLAPAISFSWAREHLAFSPSSRRKATLERQAFSVAWVSSLHDYCVFGLWPLEVLLKGHVVRHL